MWGGGVSNNIKFVLPLTVIITINSNINGNINSNITITINVGINIWNLFSIVFVKRSFVKTYILFHRKQHLILYVWFFPWT